MSETDIVIIQTKKWIADVVVATNFCPFAAKEMKRGSIHYEVINAESSNRNLDFLNVAFIQLNNNDAIETTLLIFPDSFESFTDFLQLLAKAERYLKRTGYEGVYQLASFHPQYLFEGADEDDAANYTNRSLYPMLHLLREESLSRAIDSHPDPEGIPERNIAYARKKGLAAMKLLRDNCF